jgi:anti-sigma regulatory factor (Ser/Thr protein kinase)
MNDFAINARTQADVEQARRRARSLARSLSFSTENTERIVLAVSELAANLVRHAAGGGF